MPINSLQQQAFNKSQEFINQVEAEVKKQALDAADDPALDESQKMMMAQVVKEPNRFYFPSTIVSDYDWTVKFDPWAENPASAEGAIQTFVTKWFSFLTNIYPPPPP